MSYSSKKAAVKDTATIFGWLIRAAAFVVAIPVTLIVVLIMWGIKRGKSKRNIKASRK